MLLLSLHVQFRLSSYEIIAKKMREEDAYKFIQRPLYIQGLGPLATYVILCDLVPRLLKTRSAMLDQMLGHIMARFTTVLEVLTNFGLNVEQFDGCSPFTQHKVDT